MGTRKEREAAERRQREELERWLARNDRARVVLPEALRVLARLLEASGLPVDQEGAGGEDGWKLHIVGGWDVVLFPDGRLSGLDVRRAFSSDPVYREMVKTWAGYGSRVGKGLNRDYVIRFDWNQIIRLIDGTVYQHKLTLPSATQTAIDDLRAPST